MLLIFRARDRERRKKDISETRCSQQQSRDAVRGISIAPTYKPGTLRRLVLQVTFTHSQTMAFKYKISVLLSILASYGMITVTR